MVVARLMTPEDEDAVRCFVESNPNAMVYHTLAWKRVLERTYGYASSYIVSLTDSRISGVLPLMQVRNVRGQKNIVGLPFSHYVQPLYKSPADLRALMLFAEKIAKQMNAGFIEIKSAIDTHGRWHQSSGYTVSKLYLNRDIQEIYSMFKPSVRRNIRKAESSGIRIRIEKSKHALDSFYELMIETRQRQGSIPYARNFFCYLFRYLDASKRKLYLAYHGRRPIAGLMMMFQGRRAIYAYGASKSDSALLKYRPNDLLFWRSIEDAHSQRFEIYDFGITPLTNDSLLRFKTQWGTENRRLYYSYFLCQAKTVSRVKRSGITMKVASTILGSLPTPVFKVVGSNIIRFFG